MPTLTDFLKSQPPLIMGLTVVIVAFFYGWVVPGSRITEVATQCTTDKTALASDRDRWLRVAMYGDRVLSRQAQNIADVAPTSASPAEQVSSITIRPKPVSPKLRAEIQRPVAPTSDPAAVEKRIEASEKVLQSAPVPTRKH